MPSNSITAMARFIRSSQAALQDDMSDAQEVSYLEDTAAWQEFYCHAAQSQGVSVAVCDPIIMGHF